MKKLISLLLVMVMMLSIASIVTAESEKIKLVVWSFTDELQGILDNYYIPAHPDVEITYVLYSTEEFFQTAFPTMMAATPGSAEAPDVFALEADYAKEWINSDHTAPLTDIGFTEEELAVSVPSVVDFGRDPNGVAKALSWQSTPGALFYRASLAEEYLDVEDPEEFQELVKDWETFFETAEELNQNSEGSVKMFNSIGDIYKPFFYQRQTGWVKDGKLVIDPAMIELMEYAKKAKDEGLYNMGEQWQETWFAGMKTDTTMAYFLPTWGLHYTLKPNSGGEAVGEGTYGDWRMVTGPVGYSWGGTWLGANATKVKEADDAKKAAIKELIRYITLDYDFLKQYAKDSGDFVSNIKVAQDIVAEGGTPNDFLGGQDHYQMFSESSLLISDSTTGYDGVMNDLFTRFALTPYLNGEVEMDEGIANFKTEVKTAYSDIEVD
ncbi:MAG TPA: carbohydrate ABC transporter substrate-binding protein [Clostridiales bacterium]|jgi:hypothetical protein|nr:carbohydrate ABC transporter substrate-binding protein [Clostridiales bacterium]